jgi:heme-degrading monooxygenase HmoA
MFARVTMVEIDPVRMSPAAAVDRFKKQVLPELRQQPGYEGVLVLNSPEGKGMLISLWSTAEAAQSTVSSGYYEAQLGKFLTVFRAPPGREQYEVVIAEDLHAVTA